MSGRDPHEDGWSPLHSKLLFDPTFVIAVGVAASQLAHALAAGHVATGVLSFSVATFAVMLGLDQLHLVRLGLRHRRLGLPADDDACRWWAW